jgi:hypothetical protein
MTGASDVGTVVADAGVTGETLGADTPNQRPITVAQMRTTAF